MRPRISPGRKVRLTSSIARRPWKSTTTPSTSRLAAEASAPPLSGWIIMTPLAADGLFRHLLRLDDADDIAGLAALDLEQDQVTLHVDMAILGEGRRAGEQRLVDKDFQLLAYLARFERSGLFDRLGPALDDAVAGERM